MRLCACEQGNLSVFFTLDWIAVQTTWRIAILFCTSAAFVTDYLTT